MSNLSEVMEQREAVITAALKICLFEKAIASDPKALNAALKAEDELALAAKALVDAINDLPPGRHLKGWRS
jgi:hypothetical protein